MRMDTVIMGGGLSGLMCGIALARCGQRVAIVSSGQSQLHFYGGSMELLGQIEGQTVTHPLEAIASLPATHPYSKVGVQSIEQLAQEAQQLLADAGINMSGSASVNHWRITPMGVAKPAWLTLNDYVRIEDLHHLSWQRVALMNIKGFLDQPIGMLANGLRKLGLTIDVHDFTTDELTSLRRSPSEMRPTSIAKRLVSHSALERVAHEINRLAQEADLILLPAVLNLSDDDSTASLQAMIEKPIRFVATLPPSVSGARMQAQLRHYFQMLGGTYLLGDTVVSGTLEGDRLTNVQTINLGDMPLRASNYVLATGTFVSKGLVANYERVYEPILDVDVDADDERKQWSRFGFMNEQPYMHYGVATDSDLHCIKGGATISNLWAIGSVLSGHDAIKMGDGTGVSLITAMAVAKKISTQQTAK